MFLKFSQPFCGSQLSHPCPRHTLVMSVLKCNESSEHLTKMDLVHWTPRKLSRSCVLSTSRPSDQPWTLGQIERLALYVISIILYVIFVFFYMFLKSSSFCSLKNFFHRWPDENLYMFIKRCHHDLQTGCSPEAPWHPWHFLQPQESAISVVDEDSTGTVEFHEFVHLLTIYMKTEGFSRSLPQDAAESGW